LGFYLGGKRFSINTVSIFETVGG